MPDWTRATTEADRLARAWSEAAGPGGAILLFDSAGIRHAASGGFASLEHAIPFTPALAPHGPSPSARGKWWAPGVRSA